MENNINNKTGWECPKCHNVYAPWMPSCTSCQKTVISKTTSTTTNEIGLTLNPNGSSPIATTTLNPNDLTIATGTPNYIPVSLNADSIGTLKEYNPSKITLYCCIWWENGGVYSSRPTTLKENAEEYLSNMLNHNYSCKIYKFEVERPINEKTK